MLNIKIFTLLRISRGGQQRSAGCKSAPKQVPLIRWEHTYLNPSGQLLPTEASTSGEGACQAGCIAAPTTVELVCTPSRKGLASTRRSASGEDQLVGYGFDALFRGTAPRRTGTSNAK
jgi:hypothetical protein